MGINEVIDQLYEDRRDYINEWNSLLQGGLTSLNRERAWKEFEESFQKERNIKIRSEGLYSVTY